MNIYKRKKTIEQEVWAQPISNEDIEKEYSNIECVSLCGDMVVSYEDKKKYYSIAEKALNELFEETNYKFYIFVRLIMQNSNSKVENHLKIWKKLKIIQEKSLNLGVEIKIDERKYSYYCGVIEFVENDFKNIMKFSNEYIASMIFWSEKFDINNAEEIRDIAEILYQEKNYSLEECQKQGGIFCLGKRHGILKILDDTTGIDINVIFNKELSEFVKVSQKWVETKINENKYK